MLSRVADSLYWMSRYLERAEHTARVTGVQLNLIPEQPPEMNRNRWSRVLSSLGLEAGEIEQGGAQPVLDLLCYDPASRASVVHGVMAARFNARQVREEISSEMWEQLNRLYHRVVAAGSGVNSDADHLAFLDQAKEGAQLFMGMTDSTMTHGEGWRFIELGRYLERAQNVARLLEAHFDFYQTDISEPGEEPGALSYPEWIGLLKSATAFEAYCKVHTPAVLPRRVAEFLVLSNRFPHSVRFALDRVHDALVAISEDSPSRRSQTVMRRAGRQRALLGYSHIDELLGQGIGATLAAIRDEWPLCTADSMMLSSATRSRPPWETRMYYRIRHLTRFRYSEPVSESIMEVRMHPRTEARQRCLDYQLAVTPKANIHVYREHLGNTVHHFDIPSLHNKLQLMAESVVEMKPWPDPPGHLPASAWGDLDNDVQTGDFWEMLLPSQYCRSTPLLEAIAAEFDARRRDDPMSLLRELSAHIFDAFEYTPKSTQVDSPIDEALAQRRGVCQDFAHIFIALARLLGIPSRYVSGYLHHRQQDHDRSSDGATHAWAECWLPGLGWIGFDPTNNLLAGERHIRTALGRDYADVPPNRGVFKGGAATELTVAVDVSPCDDLPPELAELTLPEEGSFPQDVIALDPQWTDWEIQQQQQQQ